MALMLAAPLARADDLDVVRGRLLAQFTASTAPADDPFVQPAVASACANGASLVASLAANGRWPDLAYGDLPAGRSSMGDHYARVRALALAWSLPACSGSYHDDNMLRGIQAALEFMAPAFCASCARPGNWWWWNIGVPLSLGPTLLMLQGALDAGTFAQALDALEANVGAQDELNGANLADHAMNWLMVALLRGSAQQAAGAQTEMNDVCQVQPSGVAYLDQEGLKADGSFHQHYGQLYTGSYGQVFTVNVARYALLTQGTSLALSAEAMNTFTDYMLVGTTWALYGIDFDVNVVGRASSRRGNHASGALGALLRVALQPSSQQQALLSATTALLDTWPYGFSLEDAPLVALVRNEAASPAWPSGLRVYPDSDFVIQRGAGFYASVKMLSARALSGEDTNNEGKRGGRQSDGRLSLMLNGDEYAGDVLPTLDWARLPGITVELTGHAADNRYGPGLAEFVGGTSDATRGVVAMEYIPNGITGVLLTARRSWFFFDDAIVFLASAIDCPSPNPVQTIVEQWPLPLLDTPVYANGTAVDPGDTPTGATVHAAWMTSDGLGYWFPGGTDVHVSRRVQTGSWSDYGLGPDAPVQAPILTVWLEHGTQVSGGDAAYAILPNMEEAAMADWAAAAPIEVVENSPTGAAVRDLRDGALGVVFWYAGSVAGITADAPAVLWMSRQPDGLSLHVADPARWSPVLHLVLDGLWQAANGADNGGPVTSVNGTTTLRFALEQGRTVTATLEPAPPPGTDPARRRGGGCSCTLAPRLPVGWLCLVAWMGCRQRTRRGRL